jgi:integrase
MGDVMVRHKLTDAKAKTLKKPGIYGDGGCLFLRVHKTGSRGWFFIYTRNHVRTEMGLGGFDGAFAVTLAMARRKAEELRAILAAGKNPKKVRDAEKTAAKVTFKYMAEKFIEEKGDWSKHTRREWERQLLEDCKELGDESVVEIDTSTIVEVLRETWQKRPATGQRIRGKIEAVLDYAAAKRLRMGDNPAKWSGNLEYIMAAASRVTGDRHAALEYRHVPSLFVDLDDFVVHQCLAFTILTAVRTTESREAKWDEIDWKQKNWTVPADRMKVKREHTVPLSEEAVQLLKLRWEISDSDFVFEGAKKGKAIGNSAMRQALPTLREGVTVHGFRSAFSDWAGEETDFKREIVEWSLAHQVGSAVERAYRRSDALEKRRELMSAWGAYCLSEINQKKKAA